jgi:putative ABC transport system substrate-binding protein
MQAFAKELVELKPDCIVGHSTPVVTALKHATRTIPIVFVSVSDPIGSGFVASMARRGGNISAFRLRANSGTPQNGRSPLIVTRRPERTCG